MLQAVNGDRLSNINEHLALLMLAWYDVIMCIYSTPNDYVTSACILSNM